MTYSHRMKLSAHFNYGELFGRIQVDRMGMMLGRHLCVNILEPLREIADGPLLLTDGMRPVRQHHSLVRKEYKPSVTSDHAFGPGFLDEVSGQRIFFGPWFFGMGAADVIPLGDDRKPRHWKLREFDLAQEYIAEGIMAMPNQLIFYPSRGHFHVSNARSVLFTDQAIRDLGLPVKRLAYVYPE